MHRHTSSMLLAAAAVGAAACGTKDQAARPDSAATAPAMAPAMPNIVTVHAADYKFDAPDTIPGGVTTFRLINDGETLHHLQIVRLDSTKSLTDLQQYLAKPGRLPGWVVFVGGAGAPDPKSESNATLLMPAGNYALLCFVNVPGGVPHVAKGMTKALTVTAASGQGAALPNADVTMTLSDYTFSLSKPLAAGHQTIEVKNAGPQLHEIELIKLAPGKTAGDFMKWVQKPAGPPPGSGVGGIAGTIPGQSLYFTAELTPGDYLLVCFLPDLKDGKPHFAHGMIQTVTVS